MSALGLNTVDMAAPEADRGIDDVDGGADRDNRQRYYGRLCQVRHAIRAHQNADQPARLEAQLPTMTDGLQNADAL